MMAVALKNTAAAGALCALLLVAPTSASARVAVTVEFAYGGVAACGVGFFVYFAGSWEASLAARGLQSALLELSGGRARLGVPTPSLRLGRDPSGQRAAPDSIQLDLLRWRF